MASLYHEAVVNDAIVIDAKYLQSIREASIPAIWSRGVALSRGERITIDRHQPEQNEWRLRILLPGKTVHPLITLWPDDDDWHCDCGAKTDPCAHVIAAALALQTGTATQSTTTGSCIIYRLFRESDALGLERVLRIPGGTEQPLKDSLVSLVPGIQSGRIQLPVFPVTQTDYALDALMDRPYRGVIPRDRMEKTLSHLSDVGELTLDQNPVTTSSRKRRLRLRATRTSSGGLRLERMPDPDAQEIFKNGAVIIAGVLHAVERPALTEIEKKYLHDSVSEWNVADRVRFETEVLPTLREKIEITLDQIAPREALRVPPGIVIELRSEKSVTGELELCIQPQLVYGHPPLARVRGDRLELLSSAGAIPVRDIPAERELAVKLRNDLFLSLHQTARIESHDGIQRLKRMRQLLESDPYWREHAHLSGEGMTVFAEHGILQPQFLVQSAHHTLESLFCESRLQGGFVLPAGASIDAKTVIQAWRRNETRIALTGEFAGFAQIPTEWLSRYGEILSRILDFQERNRPLPASSVPGAVQLAVSTPATSHPETHNWAEKVLRGLLDFAGIPPAKLPEDLTAQLRPYQQQGVAWLQFLRRIGIGALLADDMGLGKTLQVLTALSGRTLVACPTSVLYTWKEQIARFRPGLRVHVHHGSERGSLDPSADIILTSHALLRLDQEIFLKEKWENFVFDEAQAIKNPESQLAVAARKMTAQFRVALTGTPIENRAEDLWSVFELINPGLLGPMEDYSELARRSIETIRAQIQPWILRRTKSVVAKDLPARTEVVLTCELSSSERTVYDALLASTRKEVLSQLEAGQAKTFALFELLLRLRQVCCDLTLVPGAAATSTGAGSSKINLLMESLEAALAAGHRCLVFSQWTSLLDRIEPQLRSKSISFTRLDGSTRNRDEVITDFQSPHGPAVLLLSLKAGGVGLTLTAADHLYLMDPWWNPAVEEQAAARAHRIGQTRPVWVHRLVALSTIEERILDLQREKRDLLDRLLAGADAATSLTREDLIRLIQ